jgi:hypothetical protein
VTFPTRWPADPALSTPRPGEGAAVTPIDPSDWQSNLIGLLARLEYLRTEMTGRRLTDDAGHLLDVAEMMVLAVEDLARRTPFPDDTAAAQAEAVGRAGAFFAAAAALKRPQAKGLFRSVLAAFKDDPKSVSGRAVRDCLTAAVEALHSYFSLFTERFPSSTTARGWVDAASSFLAELKQEVRSLPEY